MQKHQLVRHFPGKAHFVGHHHHGAAFLGQVLHDLEHFAHQLRIQRRSRFVEQHHLRFHRQRASNRYALLLATGHVARERILTMAHADFGQVMLGLFTGLFLRYAQHVHRGFHHVFNRGHVRPQVEMLEHHGQA